MDKTKLEEKITRVASELFLIPTEQRENSADFLSVRTKLADLVWRWAKLIFNHNRLENAGKEIMECINCSLKNFDGESRDYICYISKSIKTEIERANEKKLVFENSIISIPEQKRRKINKLLRYANEYGKDIQLIETQRKVALIFGYTVDGISELVKIYFQSRVCGETEISSDGAVISLFDNADIFNADLYDKTDGPMIQRESLKEALLMIDEKFSGVQERTKPYLSALILRQVLEELSSANADYKTYFEYLNGKAFFTTSAACKVKDFFLKNKRCPSQQEVAEWFNRDKTDASRTFREFLKKLGYTTQY